MHLGVPKSYTYRSIGSGFREDLGSFYVRKHGAWVWRDGEYISLSMVEG
jgi:hypothetical protein